MNLIIISIVSILFVIFFLYFETNSLKNLLYKKRSEQFSIEEVVTTINEGTTTESSGLCSSTVTAQSERPQTITTLNSFSKEIREGIEHINAGINSLNSDEIKNEA